MKKLKIALTLLLALTCSLFLFACGEDSSDLFIQDDEISGQKTTFQEGEDFSTGDIKLVVYYNGVDEGVELTPEQYDVDSSAYNKSLAGTYRIYLIPKNQSPTLTQNGNDNRYKASYDVTVEHSWQDEGNGKYTCPCGAVRQSYSDLTSQVTTVAWGNPATYNPGANPYPNAKAPITGENHVAIDNIVEGQSLTVTLRIDAVDTGNTWNTPLMGVRNGGNGILPREDNYVIGTAAGYVTPDGGTKDSAVGNFGLATGEADNWVVYSDGSTWNASDLAPSGDKFATDVIEYNYQLGGVMKISHTMTPANGGASKTLTYTFTVPAGAYELVAYGEKVTYTITAAEFVASRELKEFKNTSNPTNLKQAEGKMFDTAGIGTEATFNAGDPVKNSYNYYAYIDVENEDGEGFVKTRVNLASEPLQAGMYDFHTEFGGHQAYFTNDGKETPADKTAAEKASNSLITVIPTYVSGATNAAIEKDGTQFEAPEVTYDYALSASKDGIQIVASGYAAKLTEAQKTALGTANDNFVAFKLLGYKADTFDGATISVDGSCTVVDGEGGLKNVEIIVAIANTNGFDITLTKEGATVTTMNVNLSDVQLRNISVEVVGSTYTLDKGGIFTVKYSGLTGTAGNYALSTLSKVESLDAIKAAIKSPDKNAPTRDTAFFISNKIYVVGVEISGTTATVEYWIGAADIANIDESNTTTAIGIRENKDADTNLVNATLYHDFKFSADAVPAGEDTYVVVKGNKLYAVRAFENVSDVRNGLASVVSVNIQNETATSYNLGVTIADGAAVFADSNTVTVNNDSRAKLVVRGTVNYNGDYDKGALLIAQAALPALGIRETNNKDVFYFTVNEDTAFGQDSYIIYKADADAVTSTTVQATGERTELQPFDCLTDGIKAFYDEGTDFYYGAIITPATGAHTFGAYTDNIAECSVCHAKSYLIEDAEAGYKYDVIALPANKPVANGDPSDEWWEANDYTAAADLSGDFVYTIQYDLVRDSFVDAVVQMVNHGEGGDTYGTFNFNGDQSTWAGDPITKDMTYTVKLNGETVDALPPYADGAFIGTHKMTFIRVGGKITAYAEFIGKVGTETTSGTDDNGKTVLTEQKLPWTSERGVHYEIVYTGFAETTDDMTIRLSGNPYWCDNLAVGLGSITTTQNVNGKMAIGEVGNTHPYTAETPLWKMSFEQGTKVTITGEHTSTGGANWNSVLAYLYTPGETADEAKLNFRADNWINSDGIVGTDGQEGNDAYQFKIVKDLVGFGENAPEGDLWDNFKRIATNCTATITWDWTNAAQIVVSYAFTDGTYTFRQNYTVTALTGHLKESYTIGLGVDGAYFNATELSITK